MSFYLGQNRRAIAPGTIATSKETAESGNRPVNWSFLRSDVGPIDGMVLLEIQEVMRKEIASFQQGIRQHSNRKSDFEESF